MNQYIKFDWSMMHQVIKQPDYSILEGLISVVLEKKLKVLRIFENGDRLKEVHDNDNRIDLLVEELNNNHRYLVELQNHNEYAYYERTIFGASNFLTQCIEGHNAYENIRKIYSINIVYFNLGNGTDVVYHGKTEFRGIHNGELLSLSPFQQQKFSASVVSDLYPEYYILKVNDFNRWSKVPLEQWIYFLNTGEIPDDANAPGLPEARERLKLDRMSKAELAAYYKHLDNVVILRDNIVTARGEGHIEGHAEGLIEGRAEGRAEGLKEGMVEGAQMKNFENAKRMKARGYSSADIADITGLAIEEIEKF